MDTEKLKVGSIVETNFTINAFEPIKPKQPFFIIRESSKEEWKKQVIANGLPLTTNEPLYFYEMSTD